MNSPAKEAQAQADAYAKTEGRMHADKIIERLRSRIKVRSVAGHRDYYYDRYYNYPPVVREMVMYQLQEDGFNLEGNRISW